MDEKFPPSGQPEELPFVKAHKCVIAGIGRSGTTFLVRLFTELGLDTGFSDPEKFAAYFNVAANAGLEINPLKVHQSPYIVKDPRFVDYVAELTASGRYVVDHVFIPIRALEAAAMSRVHVAQRTGSHIGALWRTQQPHLQKAVLAETFYHLIYQLTVFQIPFTLVEFPRLVNDGDYAWEKLTFLTSVVEREMFLTAYRKGARPEDVHQFSSAEIRKTFVKPPLIQRALKRLFGLFRKGSN